VPQARHTNVNTSIERIPVVSTEALHDEIPAQNPIRVISHDLHEFEFGP
jgi:hypothetical protein